MSKKLASLIYILTFGFMTQIGFASTTGPLETACYKAQTTEKLFIEAHKNSPGYNVKNATQSMHNDLQMCLNSPKTKAEIEANRQAATERRAQAEAAAREAAERQAAAAREAAEKQAAAPREETERNAAGTRERIDNCIAACNHVKNGKLVIPDEKERAACVSNCK